MKIAVEGCAHGELDNIYESIQLLEESEQIKVDLLICCGDFQASRNEEDLHCMAIPEKYYSLCSFYKYYNGEKVAPILTIFIGGNHEASNYLQELPYGGWVAPNIYYIGYAGVINIGGIRIAGLSGIYKSRDYSKGHFEKAPYDDNSKRSVYHIRNLEVFRLQQLSQPIDICLSHDWPTGITDYGDCLQLMKFKPFFKNDIESGQLGSPPCEKLLNLLKPSYWFSAHLHCKFAALVPHSDGKRTKFLALDKCLPNKRFLQILDIPHDPKRKISINYDLEWLTILHTTNHLLSTKSTTHYMPGPNGNERWCFTPTKEEKEFVLERLDKNLAVPLNFVRTSPGQSPSTPKKGQQVQPPAKLNPQTGVFCKMLSIDDPIEVILRAAGDVDVNSQTFDHSNSKSFIEDSDIFEQSEIVTTESSPIKRGKLSLPLPKSAEIDLAGELSSTKKNVTPTKPVDSQSAVDEKVKGSASALSESELVVCESKEQNSSAGDEVSSEVNVGTMKICTTPMNKKFKRRNADIYTSDD